MDKKVIGCSLPNDKYNDGKYNPKEQEKCFKSPIGKCQSPCKKINMERGSIFSKDPKYISLSGEACTNFGENDILNLINRYIFIYNKM